MNLKPPQGRGSMGKAALILALLLVFVLLMALSAATPPVSMGDMEKRVVADREECFLGETVNISFIVLNPLDRDARLEPITELTYGATMNGERWVNAVVHLDYPFGMMMEIRAGGNYTLFRETLTPTEHGELAVHAFGESLTVTVHPYMNASLLSPNVYPNILAPDKVKAGEAFTAFFSLVNDNPYRVRLPAYSFHIIRHGYTVEELGKQVIFTEWGSDAYMDIEPHSLYLRDTMPFNPSRRGEYVLTFRVDGHETAKVVKVEP